ncbi:MAG TPA: hypothetical protein VGF92_06720 [Stellaceae bacterium]
MWASAIAALIVTLFVASGLAWLGVDNLRVQEMVSHGQGPAHGFLYLLIGGGR